jgi:putative transposase
MKAEKYFKDISFQGAERPFNNAQAQINELIIENAKLSELYSSVCRENEKLKCALQEKAVTPSSRKNLALKAIKKYALSIRNACKMFKISRTAYYYETHKNEGDFIEKRLIQLANENPSFGYWKLYYLLRDEGHIVNHKRVYRLYKILGLKKRHSVLHNA